MADKNVFAHTAPGSDFPTYISVNSDGRKAFVFHVRSPKELGGHVAMTTLERKDARELGLALIQATN